MLGKRKEALDRWSIKVKAMKVGELIDKEKKRYLFSKMDKYLTDTLKYNMNRGFQKYKEFTKFARIQKKFFLGLYNTTFGKMNEAFRRWKTAAENEKLYGVQRAASLLEKKMNELLLISYKRRFDLLKEEWNEI